MPYSDYLAYLDKLKDPNSDFYDVDLYNFYTYDERNFFIYDDSKQMKYCKLNFNLENLTRLSKLNNLCLVQLNM